MTKMAETRRPIRPSKSLSEVHAGCAVNAAAAAADGSVPRTTRLATACTPSNPPAHEAVLGLPTAIEATI